MHTTNYIEIRQRALRVAQRLERDGISKAGTVFSAPVRSTTQSILACSPTRSSGSSITRKIACS
jgi:hypothetical protein